jgi:hypothetical protein
VRDGLVTGNAKWRGAQRSIKILVIDIIGGAVGEKAYIELNLSSEV